MGDDDINKGLNGDMKNRSTGDPKLDEAVKQWLSWDKNPCTLSQMRSLVADSRVDELSMRLMSRMSFGTAGLRAKMGAGFNRINDLTVIQSTQGLYAYLSRCFSDLKSRGIVIGYDTRGQEESGCTSERLAKLTAAVFLCRDVQVHLFSSYVPTPYVPYAVQKLGAAAGVMITASHNPKEDNGYKVYWANGAQIASPHDKEILQSIKKHLEPFSDRCWDAHLCENSCLRTDPLTHINTCYMEELKTLCFHRDLNSVTPLKFVHSSFHGVGHFFVREAFQVFGFDPPIAVAEQREPDPSFTSVPCPNPEEGRNVLELSIRLAEREDACVVLATDPDADRLAVAEKTEGCGWKVFSGNELAALIGWWMLVKWRQKHNPTPSDMDSVYMLATTVSSKILHAFARTEGFHFEETLPGFKWIGNRIQELSKTGNTVIFAFEESIGFLCGSMVPEKDGVSAAAVVAELASFLQTKNLTLTQQLVNIYTTYGFHLSKTSYVICNEPRTIEKIFSRIRNFNGEKNTYPQSCCGIKIDDIRDVTTGYDSSQPDKRSVLPISRNSQMVTFTLQNGVVATLRTSGTEPVLPISRNSQMVTFTLQNGVVATLRTSGTEPKIKYYTEYCAQPGHSEVSRLEEELDKVTNALLDEFLEPEKNNLVRRSV